MPKISVINCLMVILLFSCTKNIPEETNTVKLNPDKISVINFWAEWCKPCIKEIPELNTLAEKRSDIDVYAINFDQLEGEALEAAVQRFDIRYQISSFELVESLDITTPNALPTTLLVDAKGTLRKTLLGPQTSDSLEAEINAL